MTKDNRRFLALVLAAMSLGAAWAGRACGAPVTLDIVLPAEAKTGDLLWGILEGGLELGRGEVSSESLAAGLRVHRIVTDIEAPGTNRRPQVHLCVNADAYRSYMPSFGDMYAEIELTKANGGWRALAKLTDWHRLEPTSPDAVVTVLYHRTDGDYRNLSLWTWDEHMRRAPKKNELLPVGSVAFGAIFEIDTGLYGKPGDGVGMVPRQNADWQYKDGGDRLWLPSAGDTVYLVQDENELYTEVPDVSPKVRAVTLDADHNLTVRFSHRLSVADWTPDKFTVETSTGERLHVKGVFPFKHRGDACAVYSIEVEERFDYPREAYALTIEGFGTHNVRAGHIIEDSDRFFDRDAVLGATYTPKQTVFRVFAPGALSAQVVVADEVAGDKGIERHDMTPGDNGIFTCTVTGDQAGRYYAYVLGGIGFDPDEEITDIYATCTQQRHTRSLIIDLDKTDPDGFDDYVYQGSPSPADAIIYEMHVRDFTISADSGVSNKGKYLGLTESGTTVPGNPSIKTGIDHLVELGVTHVQIMPVQDFDNAEDGTDTYNWGYMPVHFNSPDGWYASKATGPTKIRELKEAIKAFHDRGIGVILDVVYNHTADWAPFEKLVPGYYHRLTNAGNFSNGSGCGNEFASEHPMARKFILDSVRFWVTEYKFDGFRFDLMGLIDLETMKQMKADLKKIHPGILIYGEPWTGGPSPLTPITDKQHVRGTGVGAFNDGFRDAVKGDRNDGAPGFIQVGDRVDGIVKGLMGGIHDWAQDPTDSINYFEAHDNLTCWDKLAQTLPDADIKTRTRMTRLAALTLLTSQGVVFIHSGQEMCRTKKGSHNSYNLPDTYNQIEWSRKKTFAKVVDYYKGLIAIRKAHPAFRLRTRAEVEKRVAFMAPPDPRCIEYHIDASGIEGETANKIIVLLNGATKTVTAKLPEGKWYIHADANRASLDPLGDTEGSIKIPANSGVLLIR